MKYYIFTWHENKNKYAEPIRRFTSVMTPGDLISATLNFIKAIGHAHRISIEQIQEMIPISETEEKDTSRFGFEKNLIPKGKAFVPDDKWNMMIKLLRLNKA